MYAIRSYYEMSKNQELAEENQLDLLEQNKATVITESYKKAYSVHIDRITSYNVCYTKLLRDIELKYKVVC